MPSLIARYLGESSALLAALLWAVASVLYARLGASLSPLKMNLAKNVLAAGMLLATFWLGGRLGPEVNPKAGFLFLLSGAVGIGLGDTAYFGALRFIGARRALLLMVLSPAVTAMMATALLNEALLPKAWLGIGLTAAGVAWVITERGAGEARNPEFRLRGLLYGLAAMLAQAIGAVISHMVFLSIPAGPLASAFYRLLGGAVVVVLALPFDRPGGSGNTGPGRDRSFWGLLLFTVFIGTYLAVWLQQISLKHTAAGIAQTLFATSPLFVIPLAAWAGERISWRALCGALLAVCGVMLLFYQSG